MLVSEIPTGAVADTISRKWSVVISHVLIGASMILTGLVTGFPALLFTQALWGLGWTFTSGADVAWITDELDRHDRIAGVLMSQARWEQAGTVIGMACFGVLAWRTGLSAAIVAAGAAMMVMGLFVAIKFTEHRFKPVHKDRWRETISIVRRGVSLARQDHEILLVYAATLLVNAGADVFGRLFQKQLITLGFPVTPDPIIWFTLLGFATLATGALALRLVHARIDGLNVARHSYAVACFLGALGLIVLALAPNTIVGMAGVLLAQGIAWPVIRCAGVIWVNRRATSDVRATVQSFLGQAEYCGEILSGITFGIIAQTSGITVSFMSASVLVAGAGALIVFSRAGRTPKIKAN
jgi:predicted MFS family arabinose efflux permease